MYLWINNTIPYFFGELFNIIIYSVCGSGHTGKLKTSKIPKEKQKLQETSEKDVWKVLMMEFVEIESQGQTDGSKKVKPFPSTTYFIS